MRGTPGLLRRRLAMYGDTFLPGSCPPSPVTCTHSKHSPWQYLVVTLNICVHALLRITCHMLYGNICCRYWESCVSSG